MVELPSNQTLSYLLVNIKKSFNVKSFSMLFMGYPRALLFMFHFIGQMTFLFIHEVHGGRIRSHNHSPPTTIQLESRND